MNDTKKTSKRTRIIIMLVMIFLIISKFEIKSNAYSSLDGSTGYMDVLYNNEHGLPTSDANVTEQTSDGFIWIGSYGGLIRYDGNEFYLFDAASGINSVVSLLVDSKDRLWVGTNDKGMALYNNGAFTFYGKKEGLHSGSVKDIAEDKNGNIYIGTTRGIAYLNAKEEICIIDDVRLSDEYIEQIKADKEGNIVGVTLDGDLFKIDNNQKITFFESSKLNHSLIISVYPDKEDNLYLGTQDGSIVKTTFDKVTDSFKNINVEPLHNINKMIKDDNGYLWICADNGIGYLDKNEAFHLLDKFALNATVESVFIDYEKNLWFTSSRQGLMKVTKNIFNNISAMTELPESVVNSTCVYNNELYIGTDKGLFILDQNYNIMNNELTEKLTNIRVRCIKKDSQNNLWISTYGEDGLIQFKDNKIISFYTEEKGLNSNRVRVTEESSKGDIVVGTSGGINIIRNGEIVESYAAKDGILNTEILTICEAENDSIYVGTNGDGIYVIEHGEVKNINQDNGLLSDTIMRIKKDPSRDGYWIITGNYIAYMKNEKVINITEFPSSNNFDLFFAEDDNIWIFSSNGIYVVKGEVLLQNKEMEYTFYDLFDGLPCNITVNSRSFIEKDGTVYISGAKGVFSVNINNVQMESSKVKLVVPFAELDDKTIYIKEGEKIVIPKDCKRFTIHGHALTYMLQDPMIEYYLEGFDQEPIVTTKSEMHEISYTNLKGGNYKFHLAVINKETGETENKLIVLIEKEKTLIESAWFAALIIFILILTISIGGLIYGRVRNKSLLKEQKNNKVFISQVISAFAKTIDIKDDYTKGHSFRVAEYACEIAKKMGYKEDELENVYNIALLHDIGKVAIPDGILNKTAQLTKEEYEIVKTHSQKGYDILKEISIYPSMSLGARFHHERLDGKGYPLGIEEDEIPTIAKIIAGADTFDAMNSTRPYRERMKIEEIALELKSVSGTQLDKEVVNILLQLIEEADITEV